MDKANKYKVSVILPCYNVARYIDRAAASIVAQTFSDYEVIFINDGSTDDTLATIEPYCAGRPNWTVYSYDNGGVSVARNRGIDKSRGEYLYFCDPDDSMEPTLLEKCVERLERDNSDAVHFLFRTVDEASDKECVSQTGDRSLVKAEYAGKEMTEEFMPRFIGFSAEDLCRFGQERFRERKEWSGVWRFVFRRSVVDGHGLRFPVTMNLNEDAMFISAFLCFAGKVSVMEEPLYVYTRRTGSAMNMVGAPDKILRHKTNAARERQTLREMYAAAHGVDIFKDYAGSLVLSAFEIMLACGRLGLGGSLSATRQYLRQPGVGEAFRTVTLAGKPLKLRVLLLLMKCRLAPAACFALWLAGRMKVGRTA